MYQAPEGRPRSTPPEQLSFPAAPRAPTNPAVFCNGRPARSAEHRKALSAGMRAEYQHRQNVAGAVARKLNLTDTSHLWVSNSKYCRIFNLGVGAGPHAHAVAKGYETRAVTGAGKWTAWVIAVPDADLPEQYRPSREPAISREPLWFWHNPATGTVYAYDTAPPRSWWSRFITWWRS